jgi:CheY-like chemotaxis protein
MKFLVVDDSCDDIALLRSALDPVEGVEITAIANGLRALQSLNEQEATSFDLIVIDWRLPGMTGDKVAQAFLTSPSVRPQTPVVVLSSPLPPPVADQLKECGALVLEKPVDLDGYEVLATRLCDLARQAHPKLSVSA